MTKAVLRFSLLVVAFFWAGPAHSQDPVFGQNKVIWKKFDWSYITTKHYDIYFYGKNYTLAEFAAHELETATPTIERELNYKLREKIPILVYDSHNDFQQTNIGGGLIPEGVGGFTESFKNRVVLPFSGSYEDFRHVLHHELTHAFTFDMLYGGGIGSFISSGALFQLPLWFGEGYAEYSSRAGMDYFGDMVLRDAIVNNYWIPLEWAGGFIVYKEGQAAMQYIVDQYGEDKISDLLARSRGMLSVDKGMRATLGLSMSDFNRELTRDLKRDYWPEIALRKDARELGKALTKHEEQGSNFNEKPSFSPRGDRIAMFSDRGDYTQVYILSAVDGKVLKRLVKGNRGGDFESLHSYVSGLSWSRDGDRIALVGKSKGKDALVVVDAESGRVKLRKHLGVTSLLNPCWGPGDRIAYMGMVNGQADLYLYDLKAKEVTRLTHDYYDENEPTWSPDGQYLVFASDRPVDGKLESDVTRMDYGHYHLFRMNVQTGEVKALTSGVGQDREPNYSPDGKRLAYISDRNGIANIYVMNLETGEDVPVTDILTGASSPSWSPDGDQMVFSSFNNGGFDIYLMEEIRPRGENGMLALTPLAKRKLGITTPKVPVPPAEPDETDTAATVSAAPVTPAPVAIVDSSAQSAADSTHIDSLGQVAQAPATTIDSSAVVDSTHLATPPAFDSLGPVAQAPVTPIDSGAVAVGDSTQPVMDSLGQVAQTPATPIDSGSVAASDTTQVAMAPAVDSLGHVLAPIDSLPHDPTAPLVSQDTTLARLQRESAEAAAPTDSVSDSTAHAVAPDSATTPKPLVDTQNHGHYGSIKFQSPEPDSGAVNMRRAQLARDSAIILDPDRDSAMIAMRVEEAKRQGQNADGEYDVKKYHAKFSPDVVSGNMGYDSFLGLQAQTYFLISDYMNNHQFYLATDIINTFDDANIVLFYNNNARRLGWGMGVFHQKYFYVDNDIRLVGEANGNVILDRGRLFSDRVYGYAASLRYPLSMFTRLQFNAQHIYIDREYYDPNILGVYDNSNNQATTASMSWVRDNTLWGMTGPNNGGRSNVTVEYAAHVSDRSLSYWAFNADFRRYLKLANGFTFAVRVAGGASDGQSPKTFYLGGVPNWIGATLSRPGEIYSIGSLYFSQSSFPLRGYNYYQFAGDRYGLMNFEFRFPLVDYFAMRFPLGLALSQVQGAMFLDAGSAWYENEGFNWSRRNGDAFALDDLKVGYGFALRANLGFFVFRWDVGWPTDFDQWGASARHYISLGADF